MSSARIHDDSVIAASPEPMSVATPGEAVILDPTSSMYYRLAGVGQRVWDLVQEPRRVSDIRDTLVEEYDAPPAVILKDLKVLLHELVTAGLIVVSEPTLDAS
jgi:hypothetical protein